MRRWLLLTGGMIAWAIHFFALYAIGSVFLTTGTARWLTLVATALCLGGDLLLLRMILRRQPGDETDRWIVRVGAGQAALAAVAILWQGLPALLV